MLRPSRDPVPLGLLADATGGRLPGPLRFEPGIFAVPKHLAKVVKKLGMPLPAGDSATKVARDVGWGLLATPAKDQRAVPAVEDVEQGYLGNCPLASLLAALAHTPAGREH